MADRMTELGYKSKKQFAVARTASGEGSLYIKMPLAGDVRAPGPVSDLGECGFLAKGTQEEPSVRWWYHVAPTVRVRNARGGITEKIIDPSTASGPLTVDDWLKQMNNESFTRLTPMEIDRLRAESRGTFSLPGHSQFTFSTDRSVYNLSGSSKEEENMRRDMTAYAARAQVHELAAALRGEMKNPPINTAAVVALIHNAASAVRKSLVKCFPNLLTRLRGQLSAADVTLVNAELSRP
jgi:hypothetical protein